MRIVKWGFLSLTTLALAVPAAHADSMSLSFTGSLNNSASAFEVTFFVNGSGTQNIIVQTWGFGGGTNAAGTLIPAGGFDPLVALFSGPIPSATILTDGAGNPVASADNLTLFSPGCPPAGTVTFTGPGAGVVCGDDRLSASLAPGIYTLVLSDASNVPNAVNPGPPISTHLSDGFADLTGGVFQTCNVTAGGLTCINHTSNYAVDILDNTSSGLSTAPEPGTLVLTASGLLGLLYQRRRPGRKPRRA